MAEVDAENSEIAPSSIIAAFSASLNSPQVKQDDPVLKKCIEVCVQYGLAPSDMVTKWEAHCDTVDYDMEKGPLVTHLESIAQTLITAKKKKESAIKGRPGMRTPMTKENIPSAQLGNKKIGGEPPVLGSPSFVTPGKRRGPETPGSVAPSSSRARMLPQTPQADPLQTPMKDTPDSAYMNREQRLKTMSTLHEALALASNCATAPRPRCELHVLHSVQSGDRKPFRYMFETTEKKCATLKERLKDITDGIVLNHNLQKRAEEAGGELVIAPVNARSQEPVWCCGRVCCEGDVGSLNLSSVVLEGANGRRVKLDLSHVSDFAMFPGQIVVVYGSNTTGECITVREVYSDGSMPMAKTPASQIALFNETDTFLAGSPLSIFAAAGPFTTSSDLGYKPLEDLLEHAREVKPDVLILCGPFVDARHRLLDPGQAGTQGGFSNGDPPDSLQVVRQVMREKILEGLRECPGTCCVVIPSVHDLHARSVYPQPPFEAEVYRPAPGEQEHAVQLRMLSNPCTLRVNEVTIGITTADVLLGLSGNEAACATGDRLARLARHVVQQRSFYPMFPAAEGTQLSMAHVEHLSLPVTPDVLILPSQLAPFAKRAGEVLCVNPGRLCKGVSAGTFAKLSVHPVMRHIRTAARKEAPDAAAAESAENVMPQQLSQDFESAAKEVEGGSAAKVGEGDGSHSAEEEKMEPEQQPAEAAAAEEERTTGDEAAAKGQGEEATVETTVEAAGEGDVAMADVDKGSDGAQQASAERVEQPKPQAAKANAQERVLHRVAERTRVDIVRI